MCIDILHSLGYTVISYVVHFFKQYQYYYARYYLLHLIKIYLSFHFLFCSIINISKSTGRMSNFIIIFFGVVILFTNQFK
mgnify:CR=1 FL=1